MHLSTNPWPEQHKKSLIMLAVGIACGFAGLYFTVVRPLAGQMEQVRPS